MSYEQPSPPANLPTEIVVDALNEATPEHLRDAASYAEALAEHKEREARLEEEADDTDVKERPDDLPTTSQPKQRSRSRRSTTIGTTTGSGGKEIR